MEAGLKDLYTQDFKKKLSSDLECSNINEIPQIEKIVVNSGVKDASQDSKSLSYVVSGLQAITGQAPVKTKARKSIAGFKIREGMAIGAKVTLRGKLMMTFFEKLVRSVIPALRDFRGLTPKFDQCGNYNLGISDWMIFPEIDYDKFPTSRGLNIGIHIKNGSNKKSYTLLKRLGMPFIEQGELE